MTVLALILVVILVWCGGTIFGMSSVMVKVIRGRVDIAGRRYECRDAGPADK